MRPHAFCAPTLSRALIAVLLLSAVLAAQVAVPLDARAAGADALDFGGGATSATFGANAVVRIDGRLTYETRCPGGIPDWFYPATDVYLVSGTPAPGTTLTDAGGGPPNTIVSTQSMFLGEILAITAPTGSLGEGTYSVVYDTCQDGMFDADLDTVFADAVSVRMPAVLPRASMALIELKGAAEQEAYSWLQAEALFRTIEKIKDLPSLVQCLMSASLDCAAEILIGEGSGKLSFTAGVTDQFKTLMLNQAKNYAAIAADPPDPDFRQLTVVAAAPEPVHGEGQPLDDALAGTLVPLRAQSALAQALLHAVERYQGAQVAGDAEWALSHARQAADLASAFSEQVLATGTALEGLRSAVSAMPDDFDAAHQAARDHVQRVSMSGFTPEERRLLRNLGLSTAQVADRETQTRRVFPLARVTRAGLLSEIDALLSAHSATTSTLASTAASFASMVGDLEAQPAVPDVAPVADAGGPYSTTQDVLTALDGSASSTPAGSTLTTYDWDTDADGAFDDATGRSPTVAFTSSGSQLVGLRVGNSLGRASVSYTAVSVTPAGAAPVVADPVPSATNVVVTVGSPQSFTISGADPDGDTLSYAWLLDGQQLSAAGAELDLAPTAADVGTHLLEVRVSDGTSAPASSWRWEVAVVDVDADADGWTATSDCDDADAAINPGTFERIGNSVDDDCDPGTPDAPPGGLTGTPWSWGSNVLGQIGTGTWGDPVRPPAVLSGLDDVVQVESGFRLSFALRADGRVLGWGSNFYGSIGDGTSTHRNTPVSVIGVDGQTPELTGVTQLNTGGSSPHTAARRSDGTVVAWGENRLRELADGSTANYKLYPVRVLRDAGGQPLEGVRSVESGSDSVFAHMDDSTVRTWGYPICGGAPLPAVPEPYPVPIAALGDRTRQIAGGYQWAAFRMSDGSVLSCGTNTDALGRRSTVTEPYYEPLQISTFGPGSGVIDVSAGYESGVALKADGTVWMWGWNGNGSMTAANPASATTYTPIQVPLPPGPPVIDVENAEACHTQALRADGSILIWGCDTYGSTGILPAGTVTVPTVLELPADASATSSSNWNGLALARPVHDTSWERPAFWVEAELADATTTEGEPGGFDVTLSQALPHDVTISWAVEPGTAEPADLDLSGGTTTVPAGATTARIPAPVVDDALHENDETYTLVLTDASHGLQLARSHATGTIEDDDAAPAVSVAPLRVVEGSTGLTDAVITVSLSEPSGLPVKVELATADGSAVAPADYTQHAATVTVPAGETSVPVHLALNGDRLVEPEESFTVGLASPSGATLDVATAEVTIVDDEPLALAVTSPTLDEGSGGGTTPASFHVALEPAPPVGTTVTVPWTVASGTAAVPDDVLADSGTLTLGDEAQQVTASVVADDIAEYDESFRLVLGDTVASDGRLILPADIAPATILDDDRVVDQDPPTITFDATGSYAPNGDNGWFKIGDHPRVKVTATDPAGIATLTCTDSSNLTVTLSDEGSDGVSAWGEIDLGAMASDAQHTFDCTATDTKNNTSQPVSHTIKVDFTAPAVSVVGVTQGASYSLASPPTVACLTTDVTSGVATHASLEPLDLSTGGAKTAVCSGAVDNAGNVASAQVNFTLSAPPNTVTYTALFGEPLSGDGVLNQTKLGRVVPVKVDVIGSDGSEDRTGPISFQTKKISCEAGSDIDIVDEYVAAGASNTGNQFRWDNAGDHWIFNLDTGKLGAKVRDCVQLDVFQGGNTSTTGTVTGGTGIGDVKLTFTK
jgi:alpha-tubulin suppressor-like RCC1 family protein